MPGGRHYIEVINVHKINYITYIHACEIKAAKNNNYIGQLLLCRLIRTHKKRTTNGITFAIQSHKSPKVNAVTENGLFGSSENVQLKGGHGHLVDNIIINL